MRIAGHPIHPLLIHFPTALLPMDLVMSYLYSTTGNPSYYQCAFYCLAGGVLLGLLAMLAGLIDCLAIPKSNTNALALALYHGCLNGAVILAFAVFAWKEWKMFPVPAAVSTTALVTRLFLIVLLFVGNFMGGRLIYKHRIGIQS